ncbi:MAG: type II secretion system F family protein [Chitinophagales bacterium]
MVWLIAVFAFIAATAFMLLLFSAPAADHKRMRERLRRFVEEAPVSPAEAALMDEARRRGKVDKTPLRQLLRVVSRAFDAKAPAKRLQTELERADILLKGSEFMVIQFLVAGALALAGIIITKGNLLAALAGLGVGCLLPRTYLKRRQASRQKALGGQVAESLTVISNSLKAGYSFLQAVEMVSKEMPPPISVEFGRLIREVSLGVSTETALEALAQRSGNDDLDLVITCVLIQRQVGGNLSEILDTIAHTIRERIRIKGEIKTLTAQGRFSGMVVSLLPFALGGMIWAINPQYVNQLFTHPLGQSMLVFALISEVIGALVIRKVTDIEV